ncbi:DHHA1 domain-containing protein, partial [Paenibacillus dendritiformis]|uniref:DHHA1 domain-containing protein n=1 Tax=Paenibacillus dendritiformis TaxID=130049 RepID=UPI0020B686FA
LAAQVAAGGMDALRTTADELKAKVPGSVIALASAADGKVNLVVAVAPELVKQGLHAGKLIKELASVCGGGGGGRPDMAQAGGKDPAKIDEALRLLDELVAKQADSGK